MTDATRTTATPHISKTLPILDLNTIEPGEIFAVTTVRGHTHYVQRDPDFDLVNDSKADCVYTLIASSLEATPKPHRSAAVIVVGEAWEAWRYQITSPIRQISRIRVTLRA